MASGCIAARSAIGCTGSASAIKKTLIASERKRADIRVARHLWIDRRLPFLRRALHRLVFLDETSTNTKLTKRTGWAPLGERLYDHSPFGHWQTQTFIAALRCHGLTAPWIINAPMNKQIFNLYVETQLAPTLSKGDVVIMDNLASHKSSTAQELIRGQGAWTLFLPAYSPDLNPIEMAFAKIKALLRKAAARTYDQVWQSLAEICELFPPNECLNYFKAAGYEGH